MEDSIAQLFFVVTQLGTGWSQQLPAQKTGGLYKTCHQQRMVVL
jgi:hypothetical protein